MGENNNNNHPAGRWPMLKASASQLNVPIIGQPFDLKGWYVSVMLMCRCGANEPTLLVGQFGAATMCPACKRVFILKSLRTNALGQMEFQLQLRVAEPVPAGDAPPPGVST